MTNRRKFIGMAATATAIAGVTGVPLPGNAQSLREGRNYTGRVKTRDGTELFVKDWGRGPPVILTHAWPLSCDCWDAQAIALIDAGFRVIMFDRRGFGRSSQPADGYNYNTYADDLAAVIKATAAKDVSLIGYSMGGGEVVRYLSRHGGKNISKIGLVATVVPGLARGKNNPGGVDPTFFDSLKDGLRQDRASFYSVLLKDVFYDVQQSTKSSHPVSQAVLDWSMQMAMQAGIRALIESVDAFGKEDFVPDLAAVTMPTLILHGNADKPVPFDLTAKRAAALIKHAKLIEYSGTTHGLLVTERERVCKDLIGFLKS